MFLLILAILGMVVASEPTQVDQATINNATQRWIQSADELFTMVSLPALKEEISPQYIGRRTHETVLLSQTARFRSKVARSLIESFSEKATACIDPTMTSDDAVQVVHDELVKHGFTLVWAKSSSLCPTIGGRGASALIIDLPPPQAQSK